MSSRGGRNKNPVWDFFNKVEKEGKIIARCKKCGHEQSNKAEHMRNHQKSCSAEVSVILKRPAEENLKVTSETCSDRILMRGI